MMPDKFSKNELQKLSTAELEELIRSMPADIDPEDWLLVMDEYTSREEVPDVDAAAALEAFKTDYDGAEPVFSEVAEPGADSPASGRRRRRGALRILLAAAILTALFSATAYAAGWFGLRSRAVQTGIEIDTPDFEAVGKDAAEKSEAVLLIPVGYQQSAEYQAAEEWYELTLRYCQEKNAECEAAGHGAWDWMDVEAAKAILGDSQSIYNAFDGVLAEKLLEISGKYGVALHSAMAYPASLSEFYRLTGTEPFGLPEYGDQVPAYVFEDGSFHVEGSFSLHGISCDFSLERALAGTLPPYTRLLHDPDAYEEWTYTTASGAAVCIDWSKEADHMYYDYGEGSANLRYGHTVTVHYAQDGAFLTLWGYVPGGKEDAEALADLFDFATACAGRPESAE